MQSKLQKLFSVLALTLLCNLAIANTTVRFTTTVGSFDAVLYDDIAPISVANFLNYVESGRYDQSIIHRVVTDFVIQGGGYYDMSGSEIDSFGQIPFENSLGNYRGTLGVARRADPNSAESQWFINLVDNSSWLDSSDGPGGAGYTVFGQILGNGMYVVDNIASLPQKDFGLIPGVLTPTQDNDLVRISISVVPEPSTSLLMLLGLSLLMTRKRVQISFANTAVQASKSLGLA